jgi:hypothetical protein
VYGAALVTDVQLLPKNASKFLLVLLYRNIPLTPVGLLFVVPLGKMMAPVLVKLAFCDVSIMSADVLAV